MKYRKLALPWNSFRWYAVAPMTVWVGLALLTGMVVGQSRTITIPRFTDYPAKQIFKGIPAAPQIVTSLAQEYADQIRAEVGAFRDGTNKQSANFAGHFIVIRWSCGTACTRMALVDALMGNIYYPAISYEGVGVESFDLPQLIPLVS
jgi:hypothetical protein